MTGGNVEFNEWDSNNAASFDELNINITPRIEWDYYTINADGKSFTVNNKTQVISISNDYQVVSEDHDPIAVYTFHAKGSSGVINLRGDIDAIMLENTTVPTEPPKKIPYAGVNLFYAQDGGSINLGSTGSTVRAWALGKKPDLISAKQGGKVKIDSTNNQLVGNIDTLGKDFGSKGSSVTGTFSGADSFWFGDEQTYQNFEWLIIDDGSTDNTKELINKFIVENTISIKYIFQDNGGKHRALNKGISMIDNEITFIVDTDDYLLNNAIEEITKLYEKYKYDKNICGFSFLRCFPDMSINGMKFKENEYISDYITCRLNEKNREDNIKRVSFFRNR